MLNNISRRQGETCTHNVYIKGLCGNCGARLDPPQSTSVSMIHSVPELKVSEEYAKEIGKADQERLIQERKLVLLVDLDQTILHTTHEEVKNDPNVHSFTLWPGHPTYYTKLRPHLQEFLDQMSNIYELHIFTFGCRKYAHKIASIIDPCRKYFGNRILSRDESVDQYSKKGNLNNLFPCGDAMVCIIDDRSDVWKDAGNLIQVKSYTYFKTSISDGAGRSSVAVEDDESLERDVDKLEALLGLGDDETDDIDNETDESVSDLNAKEDESEEEKHEEEGQTSDSSDENMKKKKKISDSETEEDSSTRNCGDDGQPTTSADSSDGSKNKQDSGKKEREAAEAKAEAETEAESEDSPPSPFEDPDDHLLYLPCILERIHDKWYMELDEQRRFLVDGEGYKLPDIKDIIKRYLRKKI